MAFSGVFGLDPKTWICVGAGFVREDVKEQLLSENSRGFCAEAVTTLQEVCQKLVGAKAGRPVTLLSAQSRQEVLRMLLAESRINEKMPELKILRRQTAFFKRLDLALQAGRMTFSHPEEEMVLLERLIQTVGANPLREELRLFSRAYEAWLEAAALWDPPMLYRQALSVLQTGWPEGLRRPEQMVFLSAQSSESLERSLLEALAHFVEIKRVGASEQEAGEGIRDAEWTWERWHTLDDAADRMADLLAGKTDVSKVCVLIPDVPAVRRSLVRALSGREVKLADPRDPGRLRWDETIKAALLPLELSGRAFERGDVLSWISRSSLRVGEEKAVSWAKEISLRGIRRGLQAYSPMEGLFSELSEINRIFSRKMTVREVGSVHETWLRAQLPEWGAPATALIFFQGLWEQLANDLEVVGLGERRAPPLFWLERLRSRLSEISPPVERLRPSDGVKIYRLQQAPFGSDAEELFFFGLPPGWLSSEVSDYWLNGREREILSSEFAVRSSPNQAEERLAILKSWTSRARTIRVLDSDYAQDGREREVLDPLLQALGCPVAEPELMGAYPSWARSYDAIRPVPPQKVELAAATRRELSATGLDRYSRCPFQALALHRWRVWDLRDPGVDLWPEVKGTILHEAVKRLLKTRDFEGQFTLSPRDAIDQAWQENPPKGFFRSLRAEEYEKLRATVALEAFCLAEREFLDRAQTKTLSLEELKLRVEFPGFVMVGEPDRIEEHPDGLFVSDFKTGSGQPNGRDILENGYRMQLPFYAVGLQKQTGRPVIGVQFIELTRGGSRSNGIFFEAWNGKEPGKLTRVRSNARSLFQEDPQEIWSRVEKMVVEQATNYLAGKFEVAPKKETECRSCSARDLCGTRRLAASGLLPESLRKDEEGDE